MSYREDLLRHLKCSLSRAISCFSDYELLPSQCDQAVKQGCGLFGATNGQLEEIPQHVSETFYAWNCMA